jgi:putative SOS response-associated peptidase YedK
MCGRFTRKYTWREIHELYSLTSPASNLQPRFNICPTTTIDTVISVDGARKLAHMRWGLIPAWWQKPLRDMKLATFNARAESVSEKPMFREAFRRHRCLIPASGYYEWEDTPGGKQPHYFTRRDGKVISIAGIWDEWKNIETGEPMRSCAMLITEPNAFAAEIHDRMPVILEENVFERWLSGAGGLDLLKPAAESVLQRWPVSKRVNSSRTSDDDATLIEPVPLAA